MKFPIRQLALTGAVFLSLLTNAFADDSSTGVVLILDDSGSMEAKIRTDKKDKNGDPIWKTRMDVVKEVAIHEFIIKLPLESQLGLMFLNQHELNLSVRPVKYLHREDRDHPENNSSQMNEVILNMEKASPTGDTPLVSKLQQASDRLFQVPRLKRRVIVLLTDGESSESGMGETLTRIQKAGVEVYAISFVDGDRDLKTFLGKNCFEADNAKNLAEGFASILEGIEAK